jgi:hypothetical protein
MGYPKEVAIYALCEPVTNEVRYIGATTNIVQRARQHWSGCSGSTGKWVQELQDHGLRPGVMILDLVAKVRAADAELRQIEAHQGSGRLLNSQCRGYGENYLPSTDKLRNACHSAGHTFRSLAAMIGTNLAQLSAGCRGLRPISKGIAEKVQEATRSKDFPAGFEANRENWPKLREG